MPLNVLYVGFILQAFPKAKILCLSRDPLDTIVSNFRQLFSPNAYNYNYAYELKSTTEFYIEFRQLAKLWLKLFPQNFYMVNYENLTNNPKKETQKIIEFCGLNWQENCLDTDKNSAPIATASSVQARQKINNKSVGNWRKYDNYLDQVKSLLADANL